MHHCIGVQHIKEDGWFESDITKINPKDLPQADIWTGGFPCQDISTSKGKDRKGLQGARSGLFFEFIKLLKSKTNQTQPHWVILENVKGLFSANSSWDFATVLYSLAEVGYSVHYALLNSKDFGVPQNRERIYIVGYLGELKEPFFPLKNRQENDSFVPLSAILEETVNEKYYISQEKEAIILNNLYADLQRKGNFSTENNLIQLVNGSQGNRVYHENGISCTLTSGGGGGGAKTGLYLVNTDKERGLKVRDVSNALKASYRGIPIADKNRATAVFQTDLPKALLTPNRINKRQNGRRVKEANEPMFTLVAQDIHGILQNSRIRTLTPRECFRLQAVPDEYIDHLILNTKDGKGKPISDTQLYKQAGNAVTVSVVRAIGERIAEIEANLLINTPT